MLLGVYKSFEELEENLTIAEMHLMLKADAKKEERLHRVLAAVNGINWDEKGEVESAEEAMDRLARNAEAKLNGKTDEQVELEAMGIKFG